MIYVDTSLIVSAYIPDSHSPRAEAFLSAITDPLPITALHRLEIRNAFQLAVFQRRLSEADATTVWTRFQNDINAGQLFDISLLWHHVFDVAILLSERTSTVGSRSLDVLHVASANLLLATAFVTFDTRQKQLATAAGLVVQEV